MELAIPPKFAHHRPGARLVPHDYTPDAFNRRHQFAYLPRRGVGTLPVFLGHHRHGHGIRAVGQNGKSFRHIAVNSSGAIRFRPQNAPGIRTLPDTSPRKKRTFPCVFVAGLRVSSTCAACTSSQSPVDSRGMACRCISCPQRSVALLMGTTYPGYKRSARKGRVPCEDFL